MSGDVISWEAAAADCAEERRALRAELERLRELGDKLAMAVQMQIEHGHPVSIIVAYAVSEWKSASHTQHPGTPS